MLGCPRVRIDHFPAARQLAVFAPQRLEGESDREFEERCSGERTITIAPETGSDRLRRVINKTVTNDEILDRVDAWIAEGVLNGEQLRSPDFAVASSLVA